MRRPKYSTRWSKLHRRRCLCRRECCVSFYKIYFLFLKRQATHCNDWVIAALKKGQHHEIRCYFWLIWLQEITRSSQIEWSRSYTFFWKIVTTFYILIYNNPNLWLTDSLKRQNFKIHLLNVLVKKQKPQFWISEVKFIRFVYPASKPLTVRSNWIHCVLFQSNQASFDQKTNNAKKFLHLPFHSGKKQKLWRIFP